MPIPIWDYQGTADFPDRREFPIQRDGSVSIPTIRFGSGIRSSLSGRWRVLAFFSVLWLHFLCLPGAAEPPVIAADVQDPDTPWHIQADEVRHDRQADVYAASGNVVIRRGDLQITADRVRFDHNRMKASAEGHVTISSGEDVITARKADLDLAAETGIVFDGSLFIAENQFTIQAERIEKVGPDSYAADRVTVTSCDVDRPDWKITGRKLSITIEGYGTLRHGAFWAGPVPVLYTPWMVFPVKIERQSGLLTPEFGLSDRRGFEFLQPLFWAIDESSDATFYAHFMGERGLRPGMEYRYILDEQSRGTAMIDGFTDRKVDDGSPGSEKWGYDGDDTLRPNSDRYWFRMKHDQDLPAGFTAKLDLDVVSDQDYLLEFESGYNGFENSREEFLETFGREIDDYTETTRLNRVNFNRIWPRYSFNAEARWYDDVIRRRYEETDETLQRLPFVTFTGSRQPLLSSPTAFDFESEYVHFYRLDGERGQRVDLYPRFFYPFRLGHVATIEPSVGLRETAWRVDHYENGDQGRDRYFHREMFDFRFDLSSEMHRVFSFESDRIDRVQHLLRPQVIYEYVPNQDQQDLPFFDETDRIEEKNLVTYALTNTLISRTPPAGDGGSKYRDMLRFKLLQSYDIGKERDDDPRPFSPITAELEIRPIPSVNLKADALYSTYDSAFVGHNLLATMSDDRGDRLYVEYRYTEDFNESLIFDGLLQLTGAVALTGEYEQNLRDEKNLKTGVGILYRAQCWSVSVRYLEEVDDRSINFTVALKGLGGAGSSFGFGGD